MGFWGSLFGGQNTNLNNDISGTGQIAGFATGQGESNITAGSNFMKSILSGDSAKQAQALAPEISAAKTSAANSNKTASMFGNRSGGTAAATAATSDKLHSDITNLIGSLTGSSASGLLSSGSSLLGQGASAYGQNADLSQQRMMNWSNSLFGQGIGFAAGKAESFGLNKLFQGGNDNNSGGSRGNTPFSSGFATTQSQSPNGFFNEYGDYVGGVSPS